MPWCEPCDRFFTPTGLRPDGSCPACGHPVGDPDAPLASPAPVPRLGPGPEGSDPTGGTDDEHVRVPWHFWVLLTAAGLYLLWRLLEALGWLIGRF